MIAVYPLKGLSKPMSATLLDEATDEFFNAKFGVECFNTLWKYCENHWDSENLSARIVFEGFDKSGIPINPVIISILPSEDKSKVLTAYDGVDF